MSTRSIIAIQEGDGWRGRYCHSDGYPSWMGATLFELVARDGVEKVLTTVLIDHYGWSQLHSTQPATDCVTPDPNADYGTPGYVAHMFGPDGMYGDGRFATIPGYGVAYTPDPIPDFHGQTNYQQTDEDEWFEWHGGVIDTDCEWAYAIDANRQAMAIFELAWNADADGFEKTPRLVATVRLDGPEPDWAAIETSENIDA